LFSVVREERTTDGHGELAASEGVKLVAEALHVGVEQLPVA
jgi:hypothetical protein